MKDYPGRLSSACKLVGLESPVLEYRFHPIRRWRFDGAWPARMLAFEVEGGGWGVKCRRCGGTGHAIGSVSPGGGKCTLCRGSGRSPGRHTRGKGFEQDCEKYNSAALLGWRLVRFTPDMVRDGRAMAVIREALEGGG